MKEIYHSPDSIESEKSFEEIEKEKKLEEIKSEVSLINPREPNYEGVGLGIEITTKGFEGLNLDHHKEEDTQDTPSAIEQALVFDIHQLPEGKMATVRPDVDSCGAIAVLMLKKEGKEQEINHNLVKAIGLLDRMGPGVFKDESKDLLKLSDEEFGKINKALRAAQYKIMVERMPLAEGVFFMEKLLTDKVDPKEIENIYQKDEQDLSKARAESKIEVFNDNKVVFIESLAKRSMEIGYENAPVVIAYNPAFKWPDGHATPKYSIARYDNHIKFDLEGLLKELKKRNPKWGGLENIIGSPQGEDPGISPEEMKKLVAKFILD
ncbi:MAG: hypothetical protein PHF45_02190 [Candidatus Pacebacteria bacterium]|nr:hypothetical protein [Candidatus Paceibacterota bacterium]